MGKNGQDATANLLNNKDKMMKTLLFLVGAAALVTTAPAMAKPKHDKANHAVRGDVNRNGVPDYRERVYADLNGNGILDNRERRRVDVNRNGVDDWRERWIDRNGNGIDDRREGFRYSGSRYGGAVCPPGLAKKDPMCIPPGQAKRMFREGQRIGNGYRYYTPYGNIPLDYRTTYNLDDDYRYIYRNNYIYEVDPATSLVTRVISLML